MTDLDEVPSDALIDELAKRFDAYVIAASRKQTKDTTGRMIRYCGQYEKVISLCAIAQWQITKQYDADPAYESDGI